MSEFNLSKKCNKGWDDEHYCGKDIKKFLKLEFQLILMLNDGKITLDKFIEKRKQLAGENLMKLNITERRLK